MEGVGFVPASELKAGDIIRTADGRNLPITKVEREELEEPVLVYNFEVEDFHTYYVSGLGVLVHNTCPVGSGSKTNKLLSGEGDIGTYKDLVKAGKRGDNITPHHMPSAEYMSKKGVAKNNGLCMNMEMPNPGTGGRHRLTNTYGRNMTDAEKSYYYLLSPRDALAYDIKNVREIYQSQGLYSEIRPQLQQYIKEYKKLMPELFEK